jgi:hypothetical protein
VLTTGLTDLLNAKGKWNWEESHEKAFKEIKEVLKKPLKNMPIDVNAELVLQTDASKWWNSWNFIAR